MQKKSLWKHAKRKQKNGTEKNSTFMELSHKKGLIVHTHGLINSYRQKLLKMSSSQSGYIVHIQ